MMLKILDKKARTIVFFEIVGILVCLLAANINGFFQVASSYNQTRLTITVTPVVEEVLKAIPLMIFIFAFSDDVVKATEVGMAIGTGFAILENTYILLSASSADYLWALGRGFGSGLMHSLATAIIGIGVCIMKRNKGLIVAGTFSMLTLAAIFHGTYNVLVQSKLRYIGFVLPLVVYIPFIIFNVRAVRKKKREQAAAAAAKAGGVTAAVDEITVGTVTAADNAAAEIGSAAADDTTVAIETTAAEDVSGVIESVAADEAAAEIAADAIDAAPENTAGESSTGESLNDTAENASVDEKAAVEGGEDAEN